MLIYPRRSPYPSLSKLTTATLSILSFALMPLVPENLLAERPAFAASPASYPIVRSAVLAPNLRVPWSQPVRVSDPFEGDYLAVFDQNYFNRLFRNTNSQIKVISLWSRDSIRLLLTYSGRECMFSDSFNSLRSDRFYPLSRRYRRFRHGYPLGFAYDDFPDSVCVVTSGTQKITELSVKVGDRVFKVTGTSNRFPVSEALATALKTASDENAKVRLVAENGEVIDSEIGKATVRAWKAVY